MTTRSITAETGSERAREDLTAGEWRGEHQEKG